MCRTVQRRGVGVPCAKQLPVPNTQMKTRAPPKATGIAHPVPSRGRRCPAAAARLAALHRQRRALPLRDARLALGQQPLAVGGEALAEDDGRLAREGGRGALASGGLKGGRGYGVG